MLEVHRFLERVVRETTQSTSKTAVQSNDALLQSTTAALTKEEFASKLSEVAFLCDEWWEITHDDNINNLEKVFRHDELRRAVRQGLISVLLTVTTCYGYSIEKCEAEQSSSAVNSQQQLSLKTLTLAKRLLFYAH